MCVPISEVKKRKKKKRDGNVDSTDAVIVTDECTNVELAGKKVCILSVLFQDIKTLPSLGFIPVLFPPPRCCYRHSTRYLRKQKRGGSGSGS